MCIYYTYYYAACALQQHSDRGWCWKYCRCPKVQCKQPPSYRTHHRNHSERQWQHSGEASGLPSPPRVARKASREGALTWHIVGPALFTVPPCSYSTSVRCIDLQCVNFIINLQYGGSPERTKSSKSIWLLTLCSIVIPKYNGIILTTLSGSSGEPWPPVGDFCQMMALLLGVPFFFQEKSHFSSHFSFFYGSSKNGSVEDRTFHHPAHNLI